MLLDSNVYVTFKYFTTVAKITSCYILLLLLVDYF
jgi:hypothetical protein